MSNEQETIADIIAEMRRFGNRHWMHDEGQNVRMFADRLEAAWKREELRWAKANGELAKMLTFEKAQGGNAAAMREYSKRLVDAVKDADLCDFIYGSDFCKSCQFIPMCKAARDCESALSAPPRNCDKYRDYESLCRAWENAVMVEGITFGKWLFAPATERKG